MSLPIASYQALIGKWANLNACLTNAQASLNALIAAGTTLEADPNYLVAFNSTYTNWMTAAGSDISTFLANFPAQPPVSW